MAQVGMRELRNRLSHYLAQVKKGEPVVVTQRGTPIAVILPYGQDPEARLRELVRLGLAPWAGGKPKGISPPVAITGKPVSQIVLEDRE